MRDGLNEIYRPEHTGQHRPFAFTGCLHGWWHLARDLVITPPWKRKVALIRVISTYSKLALYVIFVMLKIENKGERDISGIICTSMCPRRSRVYTKINSVNNCSEIIYIKSCTEMTIMPISCISTKNYVKRFVCCLFQFRKLKVCSLKRN